ncbi:MAG: ACT domain-containing protein [Proteobacteria bacterium]|nr:ACT domain-containing protein [Pseudomonadota bacterium]
MISTGPSKFNSSMVAHALVIEIAAFRRVFHIPKEEEASAARVYNMARTEVAGFDSYAHQMARMFRDRPGVLAQITQVMGGRNISIESMFQPSQADRPEDPVQVVLITHQAREKDVQDSLRKIQPMEFVRGPTQMIRIERFET